MKPYAYLLSGLLLTGAAFAAAADTTATAASSVPAKPAKSMTAMGVVVSTDVVGNTLTVEGKKKIQWTFAIPVAAKISQGKKILTLGDITPGSKVAVKYTKDGAMLNASSVKALSIKKTAPADTTKK